MAKRAPYLLLLLLIFGLVLRLTVIYTSGPSVLRFGDSLDYLSAATSLCSSGTYPDRSSLPFFRAPGLPFFIAAVTLCHTEAVWVVKTALALIDTLSLVLVFLLARELFEDQTVGLIAAGMGAVYPFFIAQVSDVQTEALFMLFFLGSFWFTLRAVRTWVPYNMALASVCASAAALVRPVALVLLAVLPATLIYFRGLARNHGKLLLASFGLGLVVCLGPWVTRNEVRYHELILINDAAGYNFWRGTSPELEEIARLADRHAFAAASMRFEKIVSPAMEKEIDKKETSPSGRSREWYELAINNFHSSPLAFACRLLRNAYVYWRPWLNPQTYPGVVVIGSGFLLIVLDVLALIGWSVLRHRDRKLAHWSMATALLLWLVQIPFQVVARFRVPITDPFLLIFASAPICSICVKTAKRLNSNG